MIWRSRKECPLGATAPVAVVADAIAENVRECVRVRVSWRIGFEAKTERWEMQ